jgi:hypothetical protein
MKPITIHSPPEQYPYNHFILQLQFVIKQRVIDNLVFETNIYPFIDHIHESVSEIDVYVLFGETSEKYF